MNTIASRRRLRRALNRVRYIALPIIAILPLLYIGLGRLFSLIPQLHLETSHDDR